MCDDVSVQSIRSVGIVAALAILAGCSAPTTASGELTGGIYICGGFSNHGCPGVITDGERARPVPGTVIVSASGRTVAKIRVRGEQSYRLGLRPGTYTVSAGSHSPEVRAVVKAGNMTTANVVEQIP
jgi:hypothetical protein